MTHRTAWLESQLHFRKRFPSWQPQASVCGECFLCAAQPHGKECWEYSYSAVSSSKMGNFRSGTRDQWNWACVANGGQWLLLSFGATTVTLVTVPEMSPPVPMTVGADAVTVQRANDILPKTGITAKVVLASGAPKPSGGTPRGSRTACLELLLSRRQAVGSVHMNLQTYTHELRTRFLRMGLRIQLMVSVCTDFWSFSGEQFL